MSVRVIAEIGINHNGDINIAHKMIDSAKENGADIVKFQVHIPSQEMVSDLDKHVNIVPNLYSIIERNSLSFDDFVSLKKHADEIGIEFLATPFSLEAVDWLEKIGVNSYKIGSGEISDFMLLDKVLNTKKKILISCGMSLFSEIEETVKFIKKRDGNFVLFHCTSEYPCQFDHVNLSNIVKYRNAFSCDIGFSDHSKGIYAAIASVPLGVSIIEKHFTLDKTMIGPDQSASIEPWELKELKDAINIIESCLKHEDVVANLGDVRQLFMHGITVVRDLNKGHIIEKQDISSKRPLIGIPSSSFKEVIGKKIIKEIKKDSQIKWSDLGSI
jgi:sialic acid synthase SpsE